MSEWNDTSLDDLRKEIDTIDTQLVKLFERRMEIVKGVAAYKIKNGMKVLDKERELALIEKAKGHLDKKEYESTLSAFFEELLAISRGMQKQIIDAEEKRRRIVDNVRVAYSGVPGSYSEQALIEYFGEGIETVQVVNFEDVFSGVAQNKFDYGIVPIENSSTGEINTVVDSLREYGLYINGEWIIRVKHNLLGIKGARLDDIKEVYSHPQGLEQSMVFLKNKGYKLTPSTNTALSAKYVAEQRDKTKAAISSKRAAQLYGLEIIKSEINTNNNNYTRFIIISKEANITDECNKISIVLTLPHVPGALYRVLEQFELADINLLKIESRPIQDKSWEYFFYFDFEGNMNDNAIRIVLRKLEEKCGYFKFLGNYQMFVRM